VSGGVARYWPARALGERRAWAAARGRIPSAGQVDGDAAAHHRASREGEASGDDIGPGVQDEVPAAGDRDGVIDPGVDGLVGAADGDRAQVGQQAELIGGRQVGQGVGERPQTGVWGGGEPSAAAGGDPAADHADPVGGQVAAALEDRGLGVIGVDHDAGVGHGDVPVACGQQGPGGVAVLQADGTRGGPGHGRAALGRSQGLDLVAGLAEHAGEGIVDPNRWGDDLDGGVADLAAVDPWRGDLGRWGPAGDVAVGVSVVVFPAGRAGQAGHVGVQVAADVLNGGDRVGRQGDHPGQGGGVGR
jgi:hypothetical protein